MCAKKINNNDSLEGLPNWDLSDLYDSPTSKSLIYDLQSASDSAKSLNANYLNKISKLDPSTLSKVIIEFEKVTEIVCRIMSFSYLRYSTDMQDTENSIFFQNMQEETTKISSHLLFIPLELKSLTSKELTLIVSDREIKKYEPWIRDLRAEREYQLSDELELFINEKNLITSSWVRLFDHTISALNFKYKDDNLSIAEVLDLLSDKDSHKRQIAGEEIGRVLKTNIQSFALITNTLAKDKEIEDRWRGFKSPLTSRNVSNRVEDQVVNSLIEAVKNSYPSISHRYYALKAKWLDVEKLDFWDRNAPLPGDNVQPINWIDAVSVVLEAYRKFSPKLADIGQCFFDNNWIDASIASGKNPGAFAHPTVPSVHPYIMLNYQGRPRDVMTLAHELGHGIHQVLASKHGHLLSETPLTLAETASVFGEQLTFRSLLSLESDSKRRRLLLASKVEDMLSTVVRQIAFCSFEKEVHNERKLGEINSERLCELWLHEQSDSLGPAVRIDGDYKYFWAYIPHFVHSPFYVYAYAFGDCLVNALYNVYEESSEGFEKKYIEMLEAGGTLRHQDLLSPFGLNTVDKDFWIKGLKVIEDYVDELAQF